MRPARVLQSRTAETSVAGVAAIDRAGAAGDGPVRTMPSRAAAARRACEGDVVLIPAGGLGGGVRSMGRRT